MKLTLPKRIAVHGILIACSIAFLFPFVWLVMTSLKPIEQTMKMPPEWLPRAYYAPVMGERLEIVKERQIDEPSVFVHVDEGRRKGECVLLPPAKFHEEVERESVERGASRKERPPAPPAAPSTAPVTPHASRVTHPSQGIAEVEVRIGDRKEVQKARATLRRRVSPGDWLVRERINRLAAEPAALISLAPADILDWPGLCRKLPTPPSASSARQPFAAVLWGYLADDYRKLKADAKASGAVDLLPPDTCRVIQAVASGSTPTDSEKSAVVDALNRILERRDFMLLTNVKLLAEAFDLFVRDRAALTNDEVQRLNRLLFEAAFPTEIRNTQRQRLTPRFDVVAAKDIEERIQPAWWNYEGAIRYTGYTRFSFLGLSFSVPNFLVYTWNTIVVAVLGMLGAVFSSALAAYGFARIRWRGREACFVITLATMMVPFAVTMVPLYGVFRALGWVGTLKPLWVPAFFAGAFNIFLLRQFFMTIPEDLSDAARIDGCSEWAIFWRIILPLSKPALAVVALFHFMWAWKDFMGPLIFLTEQRTFTLSLGLEFYRSQHGGSEWHYLMAASTLMILPVILLFFFTQKTFIQGISTTGMKN